MRKINIDIEDSIYQKMQFFENDDSFKNLWNSIKSIKKQSIFYYDLEDKIEQEEYFQKYLNTIFDIIISFNTFLLKKYIAENKKNIKDLNWKKIYNRKSSQNNFLYLIKQHIGYFDDYLFIIHSLYIWENLFRHQLAHGWIDIFKVILSKNDLYFLIDEKFLHENFDNSHLLNDNNEKTINDLRKKLKENSMEHDISPLLIIKNLYKMDKIAELGFVVKIKNPSFFTNDAEQEIEKTKKRINEINEVEYSNMTKEEKDNILQRNQQILEKLKKIKEISPDQTIFSLNRLLLDIWTIVNISYNFNE